MEKEILRGRFERKKVRHGVHHTKVENHSSKKQLRNEEAERMSQLELEDYLFEEAERMSQWELEYYLFEDDYEGWDG